MHSSKLVQHIKELDSKEKERFRLFVESPYFNQHQPTRQLLRYILKELKRKHPRLENEQVYQKLFPGELYEEQQLHNQMSSLKKLLHRFLAIHFFENSPFQEELYTVEASYESNQFDLMTNRARQLEKKIEKEKTRNASFYHTRYRLYHLLGYYDGQYVDRSKTASFQQMMNNLDRYYILEKLRNSAHLTANMMLMNAKYDFSMLDNVLEYFENNKELFLEDTSIALYYHSLMSMKEARDATHYEAMKTILSDKLEQLTDKEKADVYSFSYNYCILKINRGQSEYQQELFELYKQGLTTGILLNNGLISEWDYKNITTLGCGLKEFEWTEEFIQTYKDNLPENRRENAYNYNLANLFYNKKMYDEALSALLVVQFTDVKYHLNTTFLLLRVYYAMGDTEALLSLIETFRIYIMRNKKITTDQKKGYTNFLRFARRLVLLKHQASTYSRKSLEEKLDKLRSSIENTKPVINRQWLLSEAVR